jgi:hypothetical protein
MDVTAVPLEVDEVMTEAMLESGSVVFVRFGSGDAGRDGGSCTVVVSGGGVVSLVMVEEVEKRRMVCGKELQV